jgi:hypothetical protein
VETFTLLFFVLTLLVAGFIVTQTIRRDLKARGRVGIDIRREPTHPRPHAAHRTLPSHSLQQHTHESPPRPL